MFALDLFNTKYEKELKEGAIDNLTARLIEPLSRRAADIRTQIRSGRLTAAELSKLEKEYEELVNKRLEIIQGKAPQADECMGYGGIVGEDGIGQDLVTPQQRVQQSTPQKQTPVGKVVDTAKQAAKWLAGKGGPGKEGPTYEGQELDEAFGAIGSKALMNGNFAEFLKKRQAKQPFDMDFGSEKIRFTPALMDAIAQKYTADKSAAEANPTRELKLVAVNNYRAFGYPDMMRKLIDSVATPEPVAAAGEPGEQLPMFERARPVQKKNSKKSSQDLTGTTAQDATVQRELQKVRARHPAAKTDIEALIKDEIVNQEKVDQQLAQQQELNQQQDAKIADLQSRLATAVKPTTTKPAVAPSATPGRPVAPVAGKPAPTPVATAPEPTGIPAEPGPAVADQELADKVKELDDMMKAATMAALQRPDDRDAQAELNKRIDNLQKQIKKLGKEKTTARKPTTDATRLSLPDPNTIDVDASWIDLPNIEVPDLEKVPASTLKPVNTDAERAANDTRQPTQRQAAESIDKPTGIGQMVQNIGQGTELQKDPAYRNQVRRTQQQQQQRQKNIAQQQANQDNDPDDFTDLPSMEETRADTLIARRRSAEKQLPKADARLTQSQAHRQDLERKMAALDAQLAQQAQSDEQYWRTHAPRATRLKEPATKLESHMSELDIMRQDAERMSNRQFQAAYKMSKAEFQQRYRTVLKPAPQQDTPVEEGWSDRDRDHYAVYVRGVPKIWKDLKGNYLTDTHARNIMYKLREKYRKNGQDPTVITIAPYDDDQGVAEGATVAYVVTYINPETDDRGETTVSAMSKEDAMTKVKQQLKQKGYTVAINGVRRAEAVDEGQTDYQKRRQREKDVDAGKPVAKQRQSKMTDYQKRRAQQKKEMELGEELGAGGMWSTLGEKELDEHGGGVNAMNKYIAWRRSANKERGITKQQPVGKPAESVNEESSTSSEEAESAILKRIMVAHLDLLAEFGPEKVMQAVEEVAYNVGDLDEIGSSDVSGWIRQVKEILGVDEQLEEKWSAKYKRSIDCSHPKGFSQRAHCQGRKKK